MHNDSSSRVLVVLMYQGWMIAYTSQQLRLHEKNYTKDLELAVVFFA